MYICFYIIKLINQIYQHIAHLKDFLIKKLLQYVNLVELKFCSYALFSYKTSSK